MFGILVYNGIFNLRFSGFYGLYPNKQTDPI